MRTATIKLTDGPMDGMEITWPESGGDFPVMITFGVFPNDEKKSHKDFDIIEHSYKAFHAYEHGDLDPEDGMPCHEVQEYQYSGRIPSISELWNNSPVAGTDE